MCWKTNMNKWGYVTKGMRTPTPPGILAPTLVSGLLCNCSGMFLACWSSPPSPIPLGWAVMLLDDKVMWYHGRNKLWHAVRTWDALWETPCACMYTCIFALRDYLTGGTTCCKVLESQVRFYWGVSIQAGCEDVPITKKWKAFWKDVCLLEIYCSVALYLGWSLWSVIC